MNQLLTLSLNDFRRVFRDPMLRVVLFLPLLVIAFAVWVIPFIFSVYPEVKSYRYIILMAAGLQTATLFGFISGFTFLEEKDEQVFSALRVLPIAAHTLLGVRMLLGGSITLVTNVALFSLVDWVPMSPAQLFLTALQYALLVPVLTLALATFARNKVEGLAQFKVYNLVVMLPLLLYFLPLRPLHVLAVVPTYWTFRSIEAIHTGDHYYLFAGGGCIAYAVALVVLTRIFERNVF